jgi:hypothetical protein
MSQLIQFACGSCGKALKAQPALVGKKARCSCGQTVSIPGRTPTAAPVVAASPRAADGPADGTARPAPCHYCGGEAADHVTAYLFPTTEEAKRFAAEEHERKAGGASDCKNIYVRGENAGYGQLVDVPRCAPCRRAHGLPMKVALCFALLALPLTIALSSMGCWPSPRSLASSFAEPVDLGAAGKLLVEVNQAAGTREGKMAKTDEQGMVTPSIFFVLLMTAMVFLLPVIAAWAVAYGSTALVQRLRLRGRGVKWKSQVEDYPLIKERLAQGWSFEGTL